MNHQWLHLPIVLALAAALACSAAMAGSDKVVLTSGRQMISVTILKDSYTGVAIDRNDDGKPEETFKPDDVADVSYGDAPIDFRTGLLDFRTGRYAEAVPKMEKSLQAKNVRPFWLQQHANYILAECLRRTSLNDKKALARAQQAYERIVKNVPDGRLVPEAIQGVGNCLMDLGQPDAARAHFAKLAEGDKYGLTWTTRGNLHLARVDGAKGKHQDAIEKAREALDKARAEGRKDLVLEGEFVVASILVAANQPKEGLDIFTRIARESHPRDVNSKAKAYNGIGDALIGANRTQEALLAYLRTRVLYFKSEAELPRALYGAARCFTALKRPDEARELIAVLEADYPRSPWTAKAKKDLGG